MGLFVLFKKNHNLRAFFYLKFDKNVMNMGFDRSQWKKELIGDFLIGLMGQQQRKDFRFSLGKLMNTAKVLNQERGVLLLRFFFLWLAFFDKEVQ